MNATPASPIHKRLVKHSDHQSNGNLLNDFSETTTIQSNAVPATSPKQRFIKKFKTKSDVPEQFLYSSDSTKLFVETASTTINTSKETVSKEGDSSLFLRRNNIISHIINLKVGDSSPMDVLTPTRRPTAFGSPVNLTPRKKQPTMLTTQLWGKQNVQQLMKSPSVARTQRRMEENKFAPYSERMKRLDNYFQSTHRGQFEYQDNLLQKLTNEGEVNLFTVAKAKERTSNKPREKFHSQDRKGEDMCKTGFPLNLNKNQISDDYNVRRWVKTRNVGSTDWMPLSSRSFVKSTIQGYDVLGVSQLDTTPTKGAFTERESDKMVSLRAVWKIVDDCVDYIGENEQFYKTLNGCTEKMFSKLIPKAKKPAEQLKDFRYKQCLQALKTAVESKPENVLRSRRIAQTKKSQYVIKSDEMKPEKYE